MNRATEKLCSIRHHCFLRMLGRNPDPDFRQAFRILNRLYVDERRCALKGQRSVSKPPATRRRKAA